MIQTNQNLELQIEAIETQLNKMMELLSLDRAPSPIIPLDEAAERMFKKSPKVVRKWIREGHLRASAIPDGNRGYNYYFLREQLIEDIERNFAE